MPGRSSIENLLFIFADELAVSALGAYGNPLVHTPNLERLASESVVFERAYVTQPVCTPSRATLLTGQWPHALGCTENNVPLPASARCLPELLDPDRYATGYIGKWHLGDEIFPQHGFRHWVSIEDMYRPWYREGRDQWTHCSYYRFLRELGYEPDRRTPDGFEYFSRAFCAGLPVEHTKAAFVADEAAGFIMEHQNEPFTLYVNFLEPHMPFTGPLNDLYVQDDVRLPASFYAEDEGGLPERIRFLRRSAARGVDDLRLETEHDWKRLVARYLGLATLVDFQCGRILDALDLAGAADRTVVVFTSDHGDLMGAHRLFGKCVMYEEAVRVPLMLRIPGTRPCRIRSNISQIDLVPTLLDLLGVDVPPDLPGRSLYPFAAAGPEYAQRALHAPVFIEWTPPGGVDALRSAESEDTADAGVLHDVLRTGVLPDGWKYTWSLCDRDELYRLPDDPWEVHNLADRSENAPLVARCRSMIRRWQEQTADPARVLYGAS